MFTPANVLVLIALIMFLLDAARLQTRFNLVALGLFFWALSTVVPAHFAGHLTG